MEVKIKKADGCQRILEIEASGEFMQKEFNAVLRRYQNHAAISGFRAGKIPMELLLTRFGKDIDAEVLKNGIFHNYVQAINKENLRPLTDPEISKINWKRSASLHFEAKVEVKPKIKLGNYKGIKLSKEIPTLTESEISNEIKSIQERMAEYNIVSDRDLRNDDLAEIDLEIYVDGKIIPGGKANDFSLEIGRDFFGKGFDNQLLEMKIGEKKAVEFKLPDNHPSPELQNKKAVFQITLKQIKEKKLPPIDEQFAQRIKDCKGLGDLKEKIRSRLENWKKTEALEKMKDELTDNLIKTNNFSLPLSLIERRKKVLLGMTKERLQKIGFSEQKIKDEDTELNREAQEKAEKDIKLALILEAISEEEKIIVSKEDAKEELKKLSRYSDKKPLEEEIEDGFIEQVRHNRAIDFILSFARIEEIRNKDER